MVAPALNFNEIRERKLMSENNSAVEDYKRNCEFHRLLRKYCGPNAYSVFTALQDRANDQEHDGWAFPSYETLMQDTGIGNRNAITTALELLFDLGLIEWQLNGRHAIYKPIKKVNSTELILFTNRAISYQNDTKDSIKTIPSIVSKRYSNVYQLNVNQENELSTPNGVGEQAPAPTNFQVTEIYLPVSEPEREPEPEPTIPLDSKPNETKQTYPALPAKPASKRGKGVSVVEPGVKAKARDKPPRKEKPRDPRLDHPNVKFYTQHMRYSPSEDEQFELLVNEEFDLIELETAMKTWLASGYFRGNVRGVIDTYHRGSYKNDFRRGNERGRGERPIGKDRPGPANSRPSVTEFYNQPTETLEEQFKREMAELGFSNKSVVF